MRLAEGSGRSSALQPPPLHCTAKAASIKQVDLQENSPQNNPKPELPAGSDVSEPREGRASSDLQRKQSLGSRKQSLPLQRLFCKAPRPHPAQGEAALAPRSGCNPKLP